MSREEECLVLEGGKVKLLCAERQREGSKSGVIVDYLRCTVKRDALIRSEVIQASDDESLVMALAFRVANLLGFELGESRKGRDYYDFTWTINGPFGKEAASVSGGGATQRDTFCVTLKGEACTFAAKGWQGRLHEYLSPMDPKITRIDLARDFLNGELSIDEVVGCYEAGEFDYRNRRPSYTVHGAWRVAGMVANIVGESRSFSVDGVRSLNGGHSRTFQVGQRDSGKLLRAYEKGHQYKLMSDPWLRVEVELRNVNRIVPFDALIRPADFFAGAYEFCNLILDNKPVPEVVRTGKKVGEASVAKAMRWFERVAMPTLFQLRVAAPGMEWLDQMTVSYAKRNMPRSLAGLDHAALAAGVASYLKKFSEPVPAGCAPF